MFVYADLINQLRMCRADLSEATIVKQIQKLASSIEGGVLLTHKHLRECIQIAQQGKLMPWEN